MTLARLIRDFPCPRLAVGLTLTFAGALGGAFQGLLSTDVYPRGDAFVWDRIEACTEFFATAGLAAGIALGLVRHLAVRLLLALILGVLTESLRLLARQPDLFFPADGGSISLIDLERPGYQLLLGAPAAAAMALSAHAARTMTASLPGVLASLLLSGILGIQSYSPRDYYDIASSLKIPWEDFAQSATLLPSRWKGGLLLGLIVAVSMYGLELLSIALRDRGKARWTFVPVAAAGVCFCGMLVGLRIGMPFTPASSVCALAFSEDGHRLATAHDGRTLRLWSVKEGSPGSDPTTRELGKIRLSLGPDDRIGMASDGRRVLIAAQSGRILLRDLSTLDPLDEVEYPGQNFHTPAVSGDGRFLAVLHGVDEIWLWRPGVQERPLQEAPLVLWTGDLSFRSATFSPDGGFLLAQDREGDAVLWDAATGEPCWRRGEPDHDCPDLDLRRLFGPRPDNADLAQMQDACRSFRLLTHLPHITSPDGRQTAVALDGGVYVWDDDPCADRCLRQGLGAIGALAYAPDGRHIAVGNEKGQVRILTVPPSPDGIRYEH